MSGRDLRIYRLLLLTLAMLLATIALGWWGVLLVAVMFAVIDRRWSVAVEAGACATIAWLLLFVVNALIPGARIIGQVARAMSLPTIVLPLLTLLFPGLLAWSGATVAVAVAHLLGRVRSDATGSDAIAVPPVDARPATRR